jgi:hypothetical protein
MPTAAVDRRKYRRYDLSIEVKVQPRKRAAPVVEAHTRDISARGVYFDFSEKMEIGSELEFELNLPAELCAGKNVRIRCRGRIVRLDKPKADTGVGIAATIESYEFVRGE